MRTPLVKQTAFNRAARSFDSLEQEAYLNLWRTYDCLKAIEEEVFARYGLSAQQYNALRLLQAASGVLPTLAIAAKLVSRAPDITRLLDRLEARGLVQRERRADNRRVVQVGITPAGKSLLQAMSADVRRCGQRQLGHLANPDLVALIALLKESRAPHETVVRTPLIQSSKTSKTPSPTALR
jgi:DNA-binding MarR family transcriptional regulator